MATREELTADDQRLRGTVLSVIALFGLAALAMVAGDSSAIDCATLLYPVPSDVTNRAGALWSCGFVFAAIPMAIHGLPEIPRTRQAYMIAFATALILCCRRSPTCLHPTPLEYVNLPSLLCFLIPLAGTFAAGALIRSGLWLVYSRRA